VLGFPPGYGYRIGAEDKWSMVWMLMNHRPETDRAYIEYNVTVDDSRDLQAADPYWLDVRDCRADPVFDAPGGGRRGSTYRTASTWRAPEAGRIVVAGGHVHGGAKHLRLSQPDCGDRTLATLRPAWGTARHSFYNVKPVLHEPGPIAMGGVASAQGFPVAKGERVKLTATYDNERPHTRVMGISLAYFVPDASVAQRCGALPSDVRTSRTTEPHRRRAPRFRVPLIGLDDDGRAVEIRRPPGQTKRLRGSGTIRVAGFSFSRRNVSVPRGAKLTWRFGDPELHDVTVADGPLGFSSPHLNDGRRFAQRLRRRGSYKLFCSLHPVAMTATVRVR
jgi:hypothetical protein